MSHVTKVEVDLDGNSYDIQIGRGVVAEVATLLERKTQNKKVIIIADSFFQNTLVKKVRASLLEKDFECVEYYMNAGKENKNFNEILKIFGVIEEQDFARDSTLIAVGGGVVGDLAGFVASTWLRGMNLVHIPTTLLAMVDSSIGGKTAINFRKTINGIGSYYHPVFNLMDLNLVDSLSDRDLKSGLAEVIKCAIIDDAAFYDYLKSNSTAILNRDERAIIKCIEQSIKIKISYVQGDVREGYRRLHLNYGHTLGHAIEISTVDEKGGEQLRHGEGVSIGSVAVAHIADAYLNAETLREYTDIFEMYGLPVTVDANGLGFEREALIQECLKNVNKDKKRIHNRLRLILSGKAGNSSVYGDVPFEHVEAAFRYVIQ